MTSTKPATARLAIDIGGTFTDVVVEHGGRQWTAKVLTTPAAPERGFLAGVDAVMKAAGLSPSDLSIIIHGTTLATNALIERKGAKTAFLTTEGFIDTLDLGSESRFEQYSINIGRQPSFVPRHLRFPVRERVAVDGEILLPLDEAALRAAVERIPADVTSIAIGCLHSFANPTHERRIRDVVKQLRPDAWVSLSSEVSPEMREYERFSTTVANAYVQPVMARYLDQLRRDLETRGVRCPLYLVLSSGGITTMDIATRFPIRLVESGPAGGAMFAAGIARQRGLHRVLSFDMGGTTAKICLIDDFSPQRSRVFEVARAYRFRKGSGLPVRIPVIEMVEIGAGGGSIAETDSMGRIAVGPASAGADPGPACYGRDGRQPTVTDADLALGRIDPAAFAGGRMRLDEKAAAAALARTATGTFGGDAAAFAFGVCEMVDENMANAARVHAVECGLTLGERTLIAFGGAAPLHAARLAQKLGIQRVVVPSGAGVGSAIGFLESPVAYEVTRSFYQRLASFSPDAINPVLDAMAREAHEVVERGAPGERRQETRFAFARYIGQGHEIPVRLPNRPFAAADIAGVREAFERAYTEQYGRLVPGVDVEVLSWAVRVETPLHAPTRVPDAEGASAARPVGARRVFDPARAAWLEAQIYRRAALTRGTALAGPAIVVEDDTSTVVPPGYRATVTPEGYIEMIAEEAP
jgi:N-methylhydantoinase A